MRRHPVPEETNAYLESLYDSPEFCMELHSVRSDWHTQERGTAQGCPLSPYLFLVSMSAMWHDIRTNLLTEGMQRGTTGVELGEVLYAGDTAVITESTHTAAIVLRVAELNAVH